MKKLFAALLTLALILTMTACGHTTLPMLSEGQETVGTTASTTVATTTVTGGSATTTTTPTTIKNFEDLKEAFKDKITEKENEDGSIQVELDTDTPDPETDQTKKTTGQAIPTMPKITTTTTKKTTTTTTTRGNVTTTRGGVTTPTTTTTTKKTTTTTKKTVQQYSYVSGQTGHETLPYTERYIYNSLNDQQKAWYRAIDKAVNNLEEGVTFTDVNIGDDRQYMIYFAYMFDNPQHFYLASTMTIIASGNNKSGIIFSYAVSKDMCCRYGTSRPRIDNTLREAIRSKKATFDAEVKRIISTIPTNAPDVWKERLIYDRILLDGYYNLSAQWDGLAEDNWTAYGLLVNKYGVCESYAEAFQTLCYAVGINCTGVIGTAGGGHKWSAVQLDGEWYMCDITFDDPIGGEANHAYHRYFNLTSSGMAQDGHDWSTCEWPVPNCTGTKYGFTTYFGESCW